MHDPSSLREQARRCRVLSKTAVEPEVIEQLRVWAVELARKPSKRSGAQRRKKRASFWYSDRTGVQRRDRGSADSSYPATAATPQHPCISDSPRLTPTATRSATAAATAPVPQHRWELTTAQERGLIWNIRGT
jgi:hypothetical protein